MMDDVMDKMTSEDWAHVSNSGFSTTEAWGEPYRMDRILVLGLVELRRRIREINVAARIVIHCGYEARKTGGYHPLGMAVDCHAVGVNLIEFFLEAEKCDAFGGIGIYPKWNHPGLHLDSGGRGRRWACYIPSEYIRITRDVIRAMVEL